MTKCLSELVIALRLHMERKWKIDKDYSKVRVTQAFRNKSLIEILIHHFFVLQKCVDAVIDEGLTVNVVSCRNQHFISFSKKLLIQLHNHSCRYQNN